MTFEVVRKKLADLLWNYPSSQTLTFKEKDGGGEQGEVGEGVVGGYCVNKEKKHEKKEEKKKEREEKKKELLVVTVSTE